ncbi:MAG: hypothetical protein JWM27_3234 [Gemmatimonadetes bacterium]|nr:hypothetical protein [Gemmatimonadota bacterium]
MAASRDAVQARNAKAPTPPPALDRSPAPGLARASDAMRDPRAPEALGAPDVLRLQRAIGNRAVGMLLRARAAAPLRPAVAGAIQRAKSVEQIGALVQAAERAEGTTEAEVRTILTAMNVDDRVDQLIAGHTVHFKRLPGGDLAKNCHHFAFGGLQGPDADYNAGTLAHRLGAEMSFQEYQARHGNDDEPMSEDVYAFAGPLADFSKLEAQVVDVSHALGLPGPKVQYQVRMYDDNAHSARLAGGRWWHKFVNFPFVMAVDGAVDLHYPAASATLTIRSAAAETGSEGSFTVPGA